MKTFDFAKIISRLIACMVVVSLLQLVQLKQLQSEIDYQRVQVRQIQEERSKILLFSGIELAEAVDITGLKG